LCSLLHRQQYVSTARSGRVSVGFTHRRLPLHAPALQHPFHPVSRYSVDAPGTQASRAQISGPVYVPLEFHSDHTCIAWRYPVFLVNNLTRSPQVRARSHSTVRPLDRVIHILLAQLPLRYAIMNWGGRSAVSSEPVELNGRKWRRTHGSWLSMPSSRHVGRIRSGEPDDMRRQVSFHSTHLASKPTSSLGFLLELSPTPSS